MDEAESRLKEESSKSHDLEKEVAQLKKKLQTLLDDKEEDARKLMAVEEDLGKAKKVSKKKQDMLSKNKNGYNFFFENTNQTTSRKFFFTKTYFDWSDW